MSYTPAEQDPRIMTIKEALNQAVIMLKNENISIDMIGNFYKLQRMNLEVSINCYEIIIYS